MGRGGNIRIPCLEQLLDPGGSELSQPGQDQLSQKTPRVSTPVGLINSLIDQLIDFLSIQSLPKERKPEIPSRFPNSCSDAPSRTCSMGTPPGIPIPYPGKDPDLPFRSCQDFSPFSQWETEAGGRDEIPGAAGDGGKENFLGMALRVWDS